MATLSSILVGRIPWTEEPGGLRPLGSQRVRHDWSDLARTCGVTPCTAVHLEVPTHTPRWEQLCVDGPLGADENHPRHTTAPLVCSSPASLVPHQPFADLCMYQACSCPGAFALVVVSSAWNTPPSSCGVAGQVSLSKSQLECHLLQEARPACLGTLAPSISPAHSYLSMVSCCCSSLVALDSIGKFGTPARVTHTYLLAASPAGVCCQSQTLSAGSLGVYHVVGAQTVRT